MLPGTDGFAIVRALPKTSSKASKPVPMTTSPSLSTSTYSSSASRRCSAAPPGSPRSPPLSPSPHRPMNTPSTITSSASTHWS
jgi:hypothetical protein